MDAPYLVCRIPVHAHTCVQTHTCSTQGTLGNTPTVRQCWEDQAETPLFLSALPEELTFLSVSVFTLKMKDDFKHLNELSRLNHSLSPCFLHHTCSYLAELRGGGRAPPHQPRASKGGPGYPEPAPPTARLKLTSAVSSGCAAI